MQSTNSSTLGPLLELADYLSGLSGGSWAISSVALNDMPDLYSLVLGTDGYPGWKLDLDILTPAGILGILDNGDYLDNLQADAEAKAKTGAPVS